MKKHIYYSIMFISLLFAISGCGINDATQSKAPGDSKKTDAVFVGPAEQASGFKNSTVSAKVHYHLMRAARKAEEAGDYDTAISLLNEALPSAEFKFEKAVVYVTLAEMYAAKNDLENEMKYRLLDAEYTGNPNSKKESLRRVDEIRKIVESRN